jgi:hypothetical protein
VRARGRSSARPAGGQHYERQATGTINSNEERQGTFSQRDSYLQAVQASSRGATSRPPAKGGAGGGRDAGARHLRSAPIDPGGGYAEEGGVRNVEHTAERAPSGPSRLAVQPREIRWAWEDPVDLKSGLRLRFMVVSPITRPAITHGEVACFTQQRSHARGRPIKSIAVLHPLKGSQALVSDWVTIPLSGQIELAYSYTFYEKSTSWEEGTSRRLITVGGVSTQLQFDVLTKPIAAKGLIFKAPAAEPLEAQAGGLLATARPGSRCPPMGRRGAAVSRGYRGCGRWVHCLCYGGEVADQ